MNDPERQPKPSQEDWKVLRENVQRANDGDQAALEWLKQFLDNNPQLWSAMGDLARTAERAWIDLISNKDALAAESIRRQLVQLKDELIGDSSQRTVKMLGDQVIATWLEVKFLETLSADQHGTTASQAGILLKRLESAQRRHSFSIRSLIQTRNLLAAGESKPTLRIFPGDRRTG